MLSSIIASAINAAYNRGVTVRYIADDDVVNSMLHLLIQISNYLSEILLLLELCIINLLL